MNRPPGGPSSLRVLGGNTPGVVDAEQPARLLRAPGARLAFASFHPHTASGEQAAPDLSKLSLNEELYRPKRVVVETLSDGTSFWRFVPKAKWEHGVVDEGSWPRVISLCGETVYCSQDQWDIYKLDPAYDCYIPLAPRNPIIVNAGSVDSDPFHEQAQPVPEVPPSGRAPGKHDRSLSSPSPSSSIPSPSGRSKKARTNVCTTQDDNDDSTSDSQLESEDEADHSGKMHVDGGAGTYRRSRSASVGPPGTAKRMRRKMEENRKARRDKIARAGTKQTNGTYFPMEPETPTFDKKDIPTPPPATGKRKDPNNFDFSQHHGGQDDSRGTAGEYASKRMRSVSPTSARRELHAKRDARLAHKNKRFKPASYMNEVLTGIVEEAQEAASTNAHVQFGSAQAETAGAAHQFQESRSSGQSSSASFPVQGEDIEATRAATIEESRRKLAELEQDRPMWEDAARRRTASEQPEESAARARANLRRRAAEEAAAKELKEREREAQAARQRAAAEKERRRRAEEAAREEQEQRRRSEETKRKQDEERAQREARRRQQEQRRRSDHFGPWTVARALDLFRETCETFDATKFGPDYPLTFDAVPWPVLVAPTRRAVEDVDWAAVEAFFEAVKPSLRAQEYRQLVEKTQRRFHPDRWRSRRLLQSVEDSEERDAMEVAANTVAQAITPLWRALPR